MSRTQVAIWRFSDHVKVDAVDPAAEKLADYLEKSAQNLAEPKASLTLDPPAVSAVTSPPASFTAINPPSDLAVTEERAVPT